MEIRELLKEKMLVEILVERANIILEQHNQIIALRQENAELKKMMPKLKIVPGKGGPLTDMFPPGPPMPVEPGPAPEPEGETE